MVQTRIDGDPVEHPVRYPRRPAKKRAKMFMHEGEHRIILDVMRDAQADLNRVEFLPHPRLGPMFARLRKPTRFYIANVTAKELYMRDPVRWNLTMLQSALSRMAKKRLIHKSYRSRGFGGQGVRYSLNEAHEEARRHREAHNAGRAA